MGSFAGALHPAGDSLAVFRLGIAAVALVAALLTGWPRRVLAAIWLAGGVACLGVLAHAWPSTAVRPDLAVGGPTLYQKNMFHHNSDIIGLVRDILASEADIVTLQEVSVENELVLSLLQGAYPVQHLCRYSERSGVAVLSRLNPVKGAEPICARGLGAAGLRLALPEGAAWVLSLHLTWPWPKPQSAQAARLTELLAGLPGPRILAGDFNMVPWSHTLRRLARTSGTRRAGPSFPSFSLRGLPLPIDHVFAPGGGRVEPRAWLGSDHRGVLARLSPLPSHDREGPEN